MRTRASAAALLLAVLALLAWILTRGSDTGSDSVGPSMVREGATASAPTDPGALASSGDGGARASVTDADPTSTLVDAAAVRVAGRVIDVRGLPVPRAEVGILVTDSQPWKTRDPVIAVADDDGKFEARLPAPATLGARAGKLSTLIACRTEETGNRSMTIVVGEAVRVAGVVVDDGFDPVVGARSEYIVTAECLANVGVALTSDMLFPGAFRTSDERGAFEFDGLFALPGARLHTTSPGFQTRDDAIPASGSDALEVVLRRIDTSGTLRGVVVDEAGVPLPDAAIRMGLEVARSDQQGRFELRMPVDARAGVQLVVTNPGYVPRVLPGAEWQSLVDASAGSPVSIVMRGPALTIEGTLVAGDGGSARDWEVSLLDPTPVIATWPPAGWIENSGRPRVRVGDDGQFRFEALDDRSYDIIAFHSKLLVSVRAIDVPAGTRDLVLKASADAWHEFVAGRVVSLTGKRLPHAEVGFVLVTSGAVVESEISAWLTGSQYRVGGSTRADSEGHFRLALVPRGPLRFLVKGDGVIPTMTSVDADADLSTLQLIVPARRELRVDVGPAWVPSTLIEVLDDGGRALDVYTFAQNQLQSSKLYALEQPTSPPLAVSEAARTLRLRVGSAPPRDMVITFDESGSATMRP